MRRNGFLIIASVCFAVSATSAPAAGSRVEALKEPFSLNHEVDIFKVLSKTVKAGGGGPDEAIPIIPVDSIYDYFRSPERLVRLARWEAGEDITERADAVLENRYRFWIHDEYELPADLTWKEDPGKNRNWVYHLHSFDFLWILAEAYRVNGRTEYLLKGKALLEDYIADNCDPDSLTSRLTWSDHTSANRMIFLTDFWPLLVENGMVSTGLSLKVLEFVWRHGLFLRDPKNYFGFSNHGIFNATALLRTALAFPELKKSAQWKNTALTRIRQQVKDNFSDAGVQKEYSPWYQIWSAAVIEKFVEDCSLSGVELPVEFHEKYAKILGATPFFIHPDGMISLAGDSELLPSEKLMKRFVEEGLSAPQDDYLACPATGNFVFRSGWGERRDPGMESCLMAFFAGRANDHDHIDPLNFELYSRGQKWITDSGRFAYEMGSRERKFVISHAAHNSVLAFEPVAVKSGGQRSRDSGGDKKRDRIDKAAGGTSVSQESGKPEVRSLEEDESRTAIAFIGENIDDFEVIQEGAEGSAEVLDGLLKEVSALRDVAERIEILEHMERICHEAYRSKIRVRLALDLIAEKERERAAEYLRKVTSFGDRDEYYAIASQLLDSLRDDYGEPDFSGGGEVEEPEKESPSKRPGRSGGEVMGPVSYRQLEPGRKAVPSILGWVAGERYGHVEGSIVFPNGFSHSRAILFVKPHYFIIVDRLEPKSEGLKIEQLFHFPPGIEAAVLDGGRCNLEAAGTGQRSRHCAMIPVISPGDMVSRIVKGREKPKYQGWISEAYNSLEEAPVLVNAVGALPGTEYIAYLIVPTGTAAPGRIRVRVSGGDGWAGGECSPLRITIEEKRRKVVLSYVPSRAFMLGDAEADGEAVVSVKKWRR